MIYDIQQTTKYEYAALVPVGKHVLRMNPLQGQGQNVLDSWMEIEPSPDEMNATTDFFGNRMVQVEIDKPHERFAVHILSRVSVEAMMPQIADLTPPFELVRDQAVASRSLEPDSPVHFVFPSRLVSLNDEIGAYAAESFPQGTPILVGALDFMRRVHRDFVYDPEATHVGTPPEEAFRLRQGVCQDFAHVMLSGMRSLGLPCAYVSGYLRTVPPPGEKRLEGADATHAWISVWCGEQAGWCGLDPTNAIPASEDHIVIANGRDYADVAPSAGMIVLSGGQKLHVSVDVIPVE